MPVNKSARFRFEIIDECLRNTKRKWSKADLLAFVNRRLELHFGEGTAISTSQLRYDLKHMESECNAPIEMYREAKGYYYRYEDPDFSLKTIPIVQEDIEKLNAGVHVLQQLHGFTLAEDMAEIIKRLENRYNLTTLEEPSVISFESTPKVRGVENLEDLFTAIMRKNALKVSYKAFNTKEAQTWIIHPYLLKEYDNRWYLIGHCQEKQSIRVYALDRMEGIKVSKEPYIVNNAINGDDYFKDVIGVTVVPNQPIQEIDLAFSESIAPYIKTKPLHNSQTILEESEGGKLLVRLKVIVNPELISMLLGYGRDVKVIKPVSLAENISQIAHDLLKNYT